LIILYLGLLLIIGIDRLEKELVMLPIIDFV